MGFWTRHYKVLDVLWEGIPLPKANIISRISVVVSALYPVLYFYGVLNKTLAVMILGCVWFLDYLDGVAARMERKEGDDVVDIACDRVSEMLIFMPYPQVFWMLSLNIWLSVYKLKTKTEFPLLLAMRQCFFVLLVWFGVP